MLSRKQRTAHHNIPVRRYITLPTGRCPRTHAGAVSLLLTVVGAGRNTVGCSITTSGDSPFPTEQLGYQEVIVTGLRERTRNTVTVSRIREIGDFGKNGRYRTPRFVDGLMDGLVNVGKDVQSKFGVVS